MPATALLDTFQHSAPDSHEDSLNTVKTSQERALCFETLSLKSRAETCFCYGWILQNGRLTKFQHISTVYERHGKNDGKNEISKKNVRSPYLLCPHQFLKRHTCVLQAWRQQVSSQGLQHRCQHSFEQFEKMLLCEFTDWFFWESCRKCRSVLCLQVWTMEWYGLNYWPWY